MDFIAVFKFLLEIFQREKIEFAVIGGIALQATGIARTTRDIDLLVLSKDSQRIKEIMLKHGYEIIHESQDILNFCSNKFELGRVDFLLAHRKYAEAMLTRAEEKEVFGGKFRIKILKIEDQIGLKVQSSSNDPQRLYQDRADIELLIRNNYQKLDMSLLREYFKLFEREKELEEILQRSKDAD